MRGNSEDGRLPAILTGVTSQSSDHSELAVASGDMCCIPYMSVTWHASIIVWPNGTAAYLTEVRYILDRRRRLPFRGDVGLHSGLPVPHGCSWQYLVLIGSAGSVIKAIGERAFCGTSCCARDESHSDYGEFYAS